MKGRVILLCIFLLTAVAGCTSAKEDSAGAKTQETQIQAETPQKVQGTGKKREETLKNTACPNFEGDDVRHVRVMEDGHTLWEIDYTPREDRASYLFWDIKVPYNSCAVVDTENMFRLYNRIASLDFHTGAETADISAAGLLHPKKSVTLDYCQEDKVVASDGTKPMPDTTFTLLIGKENGNGQYFCTLEGHEENILLLDRQILDEVFAADPYNLILKIPYVADISTVSEVHIQAEDRTYTMKNQNGHYMFGGKNVTQEKYSDIYQALMQPMIARELKEKLPANTDRQPELSIEYKRSGSLTDNLNIHFYKYDETFDSVNVNGNEFFLVSSQEIGQLLKTLEEASGS